MLPHTLDDVPLVTQQSLWFQNDAAFALLTRDVNFFLNSH
jgi:hypothetical protein